MLTATNVSMNVSGYSGNLSSGNSKWDYLIASGRQVLLGNFTNDVTLLGTAIQIGMGFFGIDFIADARDLTYDFINWQWTWGHIGSTALDGIGLLPIAGVLKNADEVAALVKGGAKNAGNAATLIREIPMNKLQHEFKHAIDFGIQGNWNKANGELFNNAIHRHVNNISNPVTGTYRGTLNVKHYYDPTTGVNVMVNTSGEFVGGWKLSSQQVSNLLRNGNVQ